MEGDGGGSDELVNPSTVESHHGVGDVDIGEDASLRREDQPAEDEWFGAVLAESVSEHGDTLVQGDDHDDPQMVESEEKEEEQQEELGSYLVSTISLIDAHCWFSITTVTGLHPFCLKKKKKKIRKDGFGVHSLRR